MSGASEKFLWVCELNNENPSKTWRAGDIMELEDEEDKDFVINSFILKTAVLGAKAVDGERNLVGIKTKGYLDKEIEQPIFSLTLGKQDMCSGLDLTLASDHNPEVEFKLLQGTGPVFITCTHVLELPPAEEQQTIMTTSDVDASAEAIEDIEEEGEEAANKVEEKVENGKSNGLKNGHGATNGTNGKAETAAIKSGADLNGSVHDIDVDEKPNKRKRN